MSHTQTYTHTQTHKQNKYTQVSFTLDALRFCLKVNTRHVDAQINPTLITSKGKEALAGARQRVC